MKRALVLAALCLAADAHAAPAPGGIWAAAAETADAAQARLAYDEAMLAGDDAVAFATTERILTVRKRRVNEAVVAYETASRARPDLAEPHLRAGAVINAFYLECDRALVGTCNDRFDRDAAERAIGHWDAFIRLAPLDPRITDQLLLRRALIHTKLATAEHWRAATADYQDMLARMRDDARTDAVFTMRGRRAMVLGNLAETFMMLGDLDRAIETYRESLRFDPDTSRMFGLAVALDRDEQHAEALRVMQQQGTDALEDLIRGIDSGDVFFVPEGEAEYYLAMGAEWSGDVDGAIAHYQAFIASGAHARYAPRALANIARLQGQPSRRPGPRRP